MNPDVSKVMDAFNDIGVRISLGIAGTVAVGAAIVTPNSKQVESAALEMYGRQPTQLMPNERRAAEFCAGYRRWKGFVDNSVYSWTRQLPGHDNPILNPYKGPRRIIRQQPKPEEAAAEMPANE